MYLSHFEETWNCCSVYYNATQTTLIVFSLCQVLWTEKNPYLIVFEHLQRICESFCCRKPRVKHWEIDLHVGHFQNVWNDKCDQFTAKNVCYLARWMSICLLRMLYACRYKALGFERLHLWCCFVTSKTIYTTCDRIRNLIISFNWFVMQKMKLNQSPRWFLPYFRALRNIGCCCKISIISKDRAIIIDFDNSTKECWNIFEYQR